MKEDLPAQHASCVSHFQRLSIYQAAGNEASQHLQSTRRFWLCCAMHRLPIMKYYLPLKHGPLTTAHLLIVGRPLITASAGNTLPNLLLSCQVTTAKQEVRLTTLGAGALEQPVGRNNPCSCELSLLV